MIPFPDPAEYAPYFGRYLQLLDPAADVLATLRAQPAALRHIFVGLTDAEATAHPAPGKWSLKESLIHLIDTERVFAYRALAVARGEHQPLLPFDQDAWTAASDVQARPFADLLAEYATQRAGTLALLAGFSEAALARPGTANGHPTTARALAWILAGHDEHHQRAFAQRLRPATVPAG